MKRIKIFFAVFGFLVCCIFALWLVESVQVSADILTVVDLTKEQTLALYGTQITGSYYTGSEWRSCTFEYYGSSAEITEALYPSEYANGILTHLTDYDNLGYTSQQMESLFSENEFLFYRCKQPVPDATSSTDLQFDINFSTNIQGIAYYRQIVMMAKYWEDPSYTSHYPSWSNFGGTAIVSYSASPVAFTGKGYSSSGSGYVNGWLQTNVHITDATTDSGSGAVRKRNYGYFALTDFYLQDIDSQTGQENTFSVSGQRFFFNRAVAYPQWDNALITPEELQLSGSSTPWDYYYIIAISTPRVTDGYILPELPQTTPNYSSQLDSLVNIGEQNTTLLQQILAKLDLIYQKMQQGESSPTLQDPEKIGFDSRTKQEILDGVASADSVLDGVQPSDLPTGASDSIWYFWGRLKNIMPPSLWALYLFALIGGFVGWVLYGKRGG